MQKKSQRLILWLKDVDIKDVSRVGGKNASLGEMYRKLTKKGILVPNGFCITSLAYQHFLRSSGIQKKLLALMIQLHTKKMSDLASIGKKAREIVSKSKMPQDLARAICKEYQKLCQFYHQKNVDVVVRSSATAEDLPRASFAGQFDSFLNVKGEKALMSAVKHCFASFFNNRAISYRIDRGFIKNPSDHFKINLCVGVQKMVRADLGSAGVMFTVDTETGFKDLVIINAGFGLGENIVKGRINPDQYYIFKPALKKGFRAIISKDLGTKKKKLIYKQSAAINLHQTTRNIDVPPKERQKFVLKDEEILTLAKWGCLIEKHYRSAQDIEWAKDGQDQKLYIVQARPETVHAPKTTRYLEEYILEKKKIKKLSVLCKGLAIGAKIAQGKANIIPEIKAIKKFKSGEVLITKMTDPDWEPIMKQASAIVTEAGGRTSHAAIVSRELGVPCIVGTGDAIKKIKQGQKITVSCAEGEEGFVYAGLLPFLVKRTDLGKIQRPKTKIMMNLGDPSFAFSHSFIPSDGVGLAREEFIISNYIKIHPQALLYPQKVKDKAAKRKIKQLTLGYKDKSQFFIDKLAEGIGRIAAAFYPKEVIVRFSDFKTNEYANLIGGKFFEPKEENPMLGWRGASRYYDTKFERAFGLECKAIKKVREEFGLDNVIVMVPFCRTIKEGKKVLKVMKKYGLKANLKTYVMCEIPSNVILAEEFSKIFDGFSIGSNDLTQLTLGVDRDSELVAHIFDERNEAVRSQIAALVKIAHRYKRKVGICGQAPSDFPDFTKFLIKCGIDSISLNPDTVIKTTLEVLKEEKKLRK